MYLAIIILPLLGSIVSGFFGRKVGVSGAQLITSTSVIVTTILAIVVFFEVGLNNIPVSIDLFRWIDSESLNVLWGFHFDSLTVSMLIPVLIVSSLVHIYSIGYMSHDPHNQRFFSYLSLFTFMMIILVTANNFLLMFVGWEGSFICLKWLNKNNFLIYNINFNYTTINKSCFLLLRGKYGNKHFNSLNRKSLNTCTALLRTKKEFHTISNRSKLRSDLRIGPHNLDVISVLIGSILGDTHLEKRKNGIGTRIIFEQSNRNVEYLMWYLKFFSTRGYCTLNKPKLKTRIKKDNKVFLQYRVSSFTFTSLNWLHTTFYLNNKKTIPSNLGIYLTPLALAIWFMNDGSKLGKGARIATNCFSLEDLKFLCIILKDKYNLDFSIHSARNKGNILYI